MFQTKKGRLISLFICFVLIVIIIITVVFMINNRTKVDDLYPTNTSSLVDKNDQLLKAIGITRFSNFQNRLCDFLESQGLPRSSQTSVNRVEIQLGDISYLDAYINIPALKKDNLLVQVRYDNDTSTTKFIIPDYNYNKSLFLSIQSDD